MRTRRVLRATAVAAAAAGGSALAARAPAARAARWSRSNYRGRTVSLAGGAGAVIGAAAGSLLLPRDRRLAALTVVAAGALAGAYDDLAAPRVEQRGDKGLQGHLSALASGRPSGGVVKLGLIGAASGAAALLSGGRGADALVRAIAIAGTANVINLLDLRPGRAAKAVLALALASAPGPDAAVGAAAAGSAAGALAGDLRERTMLGDTGANALGALLGLRLSLLPPPARTGAAVAAVALNLLSEKVSFSAVIAGNRWLSAADRLGRADP